MVVGRRAVKQLHGKGALSAVRGDVPTSPYKGVSFHKKSGKWQVTCNHEYLGLFSDHSEAVAKLQSHSRQTRANLRKTRQRKSWSQPVERFAELYATFKAFLPGDLAYSVRFFHQHQRMFDEEPLLEIFYLQGKIGPWKEALHSAWEEAGGGRPDVRAANAPKDLIEEFERNRSRATAALDVLKRACKKLAGLTFPAWSASTGRNNQFHSGWFVLLQKAAG